MNVREFVRDYGIIVALALLFVVLAATTDSFLTTVNLSNIVRQNAITAIVAAGMTIVILTGGIDLSVGSVVVVSSIVTADLLDHGQPVMVAILAGALVGGAFGLAIGLLVTKLKIPPFLASLALMQIGRGLAFVYTDARSVAIDRQLDFGWYSRGLIPGVLTLAVFVLVWIVLSKTVFGRHVYAVGGNADAARLAGIRVPRTLLGVYLACGTLAGIAGVLLASRLNSGDPKAGQLLELDAIAAVVVGGTSLFGGRGSIWGTLAGAYFIGVLNNGLNLNGVDSYVQQIVKGGVLIGAMSLDLLRQRKGSS